MKTNKKLITAAVVATMGLGAMAQVVSAEGTTTETTTAATQEAAGKVMAEKITIPAVGVTLMNDVHKARVALFDGQIETGSGVISQAVSYLGEPAAKFAIKLPKGGYGLPIDSGVSFAEGFTPDQSHVPAINAAGEKMQKGDPDGAIKTMQAAGVKLAVKVVVVPFKATVNALETAYEDLYADNVHKANMLLKSIETSPEVVSFDPDHLPKQGYALDEVLR